MRSAFLAGVFSGIVIVILIIAVAATVNASPYPEVHTVTVAEGDSLSSLAESSDFHWTRWAWVNGLDNPDLLEPGDVLVQPLSDGRRYVPPPRRLPVAASRSAGGYEGAETPSGDVAAILACIRRYESGGDYNAVSSNGLWFGAYQFDVGTYATVASGHPADASPAEQDAAAAALYASRGLQPWPTPAVMC